MTTRRAVFFCPGREGWVVDTTKEIHFICCALFTHTHTQRHTHTDIFSQRTDRSPKLFEKPLRCSVDDCRRSARASKIGCDTISSRHYDTTELDGNSPVDVFPPLFIYDYFVCFFRIYVFFFCIYFLSCFFFWFRFGIVAYIVADNSWPDHDSRIEKGASKGRTK